MAGPRIAACSDCHTASTSTSHVNGVVNFRASYLDGTPAGLDNTNTCDPCHGLGSAAAKANWATAGALDCLTCHMNGSLANSRADLTGITAPNVGGDNATYGSNFTGHNRATGSYPGSPNLAANRVCTDCHDISQRHINHVNDNTYQGNRLTATVPWNSQVTGGTVSGLCAACHTTTASPRAGKNRVNTHGNTGFSGDNHDPAADPFAYNCDACHEPHGVTANGRGAGIFNIFMIKPYIEVRNFTVPATGADDTTTTGPVYFDSQTRRGPFSFDDNTSGNANRLCVTCHLSGSRPGSQPLAVAGGGGSHSGTPGGDYAIDERGKDCSGCHSHDMDDAPATVDGLMPMACNDCHSYPGLDNTSPTLRQMSAAHGKHVGTPANVTTNTKGYPCTVCHYNYSHNESGIAKGGSWAAFNPATVNIAFDPSWNPGSTTYNAIPTPTGGNGGTGECGGLYCHGGDVTRSAGWGGSDNTPVWNDPLTAGCGTCHDTGTADTTTTTVYSTTNHPVHIDASMVVGPGLAAFSPGANCAEGTGCHTKWGLTPSSTHANNAKDLRSTATDNGEVSATLATTQVCRNCHTTYTSAHVPVSGDALVRTQANWDNVAFWLECYTCHNGGPSGAQATANLDGTGGVAAPIEGTYFTMGHGIGSKGYQDCGWCHDSVGHIGANRPVATNPYRLGIGSFNVLGRMDYYCEVCHGIYSLSNDHSWRVSGISPYGPTAKVATDTHPTTVLSWESDRDRWYHQFPVSTEMPLFGDLLDSSYNRSGGANNYVLCVSCHDPHGVGMAPLTGRRFSGQNNDPKLRKSLRFDYSTGTPTALCAQCHK